MDDQRSPEATLPERVRRAVIVVAVLASLGAGLLLVTRLLSGMTPSGPAASAGFYRIGAGTEGLEIGNLAPAFGGGPDANGSVLRDLDGQAVSLESLRGRPVWINFWASWCPPCQLDLTGSAVAIYRVFGLPTHYFVDRNGVVRDRYFGPLTREQMEQRVAAIIKR